MKTIEKIQTRQSETLKTFNSILSVLAPVTVDNKNYYVDEKNIERLANMSDFLSSDFCGVSVINETKGTGENMKIINRVKIEGSNFGYEVAPEALPGLMKNIEKSFKAVESMTKKAIKHQAINPQPKPEPQPGAAKTAKIEGFKWSKATAPANNEPNRAELLTELSQKKETARHLANNKRGAWGRRTMADEKREAEINKLQNKINQIAGPIQKKSIFVLSDTNTNIKINEPQMKTVNFQIEGRHIEAINNGTKKEDYRSISGHNAKLLCDRIPKADLKEGEQFVTHNKEIWRLKKDLTHVRFFNGYKSNRKEILIELKGLELNRFINNIPDGMKPGTIAFTLKLGQSVVSKNFPS